MWGETLVFSSKANHFTAITSKLKVHNSMFNFFKSSRNIATSGILQGYVDYHCHLLPGVDDGVETPDETLAILNLMHAQGVKEVWFTPHIMEDMPNRPEQLRLVFDDFLKDNHSPLCKSLHLATENMLDTNFDIERSLQLPIPGNHLLVETSYFSPPYNLAATLKSIQQAGVYPLLAHPCRYRYMSFSDYERLHAQGIHFQLNLPAITGLYGPDAKKRAEWLLSHNYYHLTGTDTHSIGSYQAFLEEKISSKILSQLEQLIHK